MSRATLTAATAHVRAYAFDRGDADRAVDAGAESIAREVVVAGCVLALVAALVQTVCHLVGALALDSRYGFLNANGEDNVWAWAGASATVAAAVGAALLAAADRERRWRWFALAALLAAFSLDDAESVHERAGARLTAALGLSDKWVQVVWPVLWLPLLATAALLLLLAAREAPRVARLAILAGLALLVSAVAAEAIGVLVVVEHHDLRETVPEAIEIAYEEAAELAGWLVIASGLAAACLARVAARAARH